MPFVGIYPPSSLVGIYTVSRFLIEQVITAAAAAYATRALACAESELVVPLRFVDEILV